MTYKMFLDDLREITDIYSIGEAKSFTLARSYEEAMDLITLHGIPNFISFDNDLGESTPGHNIPEGYDLCKKIVELDMDDIHQIPADFSFHVHSANCKAWENITAYLNNFINFKKEQK